MRRGIPIPLQRFGATMARLRSRLRSFNLARRRRGWVLPVRLTSPATRLLLFLLLTLAGLSAAFFVAIGRLTPETPGKQITFDQFTALADNGQVKAAKLYDYDHLIVGTYGAPSATAPSQASPAPAPAQAPLPAPTLRPNETVLFSTTYPSSDVSTPLVIDELTRGGAHFSIVHQSDKAVIQFVAQYLLPLVILANLFALIFVSARGGGGDAMGGVVQFGRIGRRRGSRNGGSDVTFADVAGVDEAVTELREVRDYLSDPTRFAAMGAQPPKGVLLFGPPGCGKTLLARAIAGEAGVPFFSISGAEFVESLVGIGAARVRDLFRQVRDVAPAIVFIDELDAAGRKRGGMTGGQEEREQTLNQLLVEMDGFEATTGIVVMGATNRPDILDPALLRPGRFDRQVTVEPPDLQGRQDILELHARNRPLADDVDFVHLARRCPGFTGADLANVVNEAALLSVRFGKPQIGMEELEEAVQRVLVGPKRRGHLLTAEERKRAAYHESGHALLAAAVGRLDDVQRISIIARGRSLGQSTSAKRWQDRLLLTRSELRTELIVVMAGAAAEELMLGEPSTGADNDLDRATEIAQLMGGRYGMSERLGKVRLLRNEGSEFLGSDTVPTELTTGPVLQELHQEVRRLIDEAEASALEVLAQHRSVLIELAARLEEQESLESGELETILEPVRPEMNLVADLPLEPSSNGKRLSSAHARN